MVTGEAGVLIDAAPGISHVQSAVLRAHIDRSLDRQIDEILCINLLIATLTMHVACMHDFRLQELVGVSTRYRKGVVSSTPLSVPQAQGKTVVRT